MGMMSLFRDEKDVLMYLSQLVRLADADGVLAPEERLFVETVATGYLKRDLTVSYDEVLKLISGFTDGETSEWFADLASRPIVARNLIKDLVSLGYADGRFCDAEFKLINEIAARIGIPESRVQMIGKAVAGALVAQENLNKSIFEE